MTSKVPGIYAAAIVSGKEPGRVLGKGMPGDRCRVSGEIHTWAARERVQRRESVRALQVQRRTIRGEVQVPEFSIENQSICLNKPSPVCTSPKCHPRRSPRMCVYLIYCREPDPVITELKRI